jgi:hypothetical protein
MVNLNDLPSPTATRLIWHPRSHGASASLPMANCGKLSVQSGSPAAMVNLQTDLSCCNAVGSGALTAMVNLNDSQHSTATLCLIWHPSQPWCICKSSPWQTAAQCLIWHTRSGGCGARHGRLRLSVGSDTSTAMVSVISDARLQLSCWIWRPLELRRSCRNSRPLLLMTMMMVFSLRSCTICFVLAPSLPDHHLHPPVTSLHPAFYPTAAEFVDAAAVGASPMQYACASVRPQHSM